MDKLEAKPLKKEAQRLENISTLKAVGILLVVLAHATQDVAARNISYAGSLQYQIINNLTVYIYSFHMPLFVFLSGYLFYYLKNEKDKYEDFEIFTKQKMLRLLVPYFLVAVFFLIPVYLFLGLYKLSNIYEIFRSSFFLSLNPENLWFLFMLFNLFVFFFLSNRFFKEAKPSISFLLLIILALLSLYLPGGFQITKAMYFAFFFYLGFWSRKEFPTFQSILSKVGNWFIFLPSFLFQIWFAFTFVKTQQSFTPSQIFAHLLAGSLGIMLFAGLIQKFGSVMSIGFKKKIQFLDRYSLSIYLLHEELILIILTFLLPINLPYRIFSEVLIAFVFSLALSILGVKIISKSKMLKFVFGQS